MTDSTTNYPTVAISDLDSTEAVTLSDDLIVDQPDATRKATLSSVLSSLGIMRCIFFSKGGILGSKEAMSFRWTSMTAFRNKPVKEKTDVSGNGSIDNTGYRVCINLLC